MNNLQKCKILLLTGYLGSGKTTLLQYILKNQTKYQVAVIQNEFADEMGIEAPQMTDNDGKIFDSFFELPNGCICCSAKGQLMTAIEYFLKKKQNIQYIIIESNGLADPSSLIKELWVDQGLNLPVELNSIVGLIPCHRFTELIQMDIFKKQLVFADILLLNFKDCCNDNQLMNVEQQIKIINPNALIKISIKSEIDIDTIFETCKSDGTIMQFNDQILHYEQSQGIQKIFFKIINQNRNVQDWNILIGQLLWEEQMEILRIKGLLYCTNQQYLYSLQGVEDIFEIIETSVKSNENQESKILFIGKNINQERLNELFM